MAPKITLNDLRRELTAMGEMIEQNCDTAIMALVETPQDAGDYDY